ncbi:MAG: acetylglutamate kinase [Deltaproteobacteria bacterium]|nr:acetylglutamate kinase [Deltaproteobacteria bacterium]MBI3078311.1 acetylglutamate kinase [Deltaproteobacteria bacterium]
MEPIADKAQVLIEALPYIREFSERTVVIKYGGAAMVDEELKRNFALDMVLLKYVGVKPVIVHGGGPQISRMLKRVGKEPSFVEGLRVTDLETMDIVEMVLVGKVNKEIVALINHSGGKAVGLSGKDGGLLLARKLNLARAREEGEEPELIDIGMVGEVEAVNADLIETLDRDKFIPVIAPVGVGKQGETYNLNADTVAGALAAALRAEKLILLTDVPGVLDGQKALISSLDADTARRLMDEGVITGGMLPKVQCCLEALQNGVAKAHVIDGRVRHAVLLEIFTDTGIGTQLTL